MPTFTTLEWVAGSISLFFTIISVSCSSMTLYLINKIGMRSGYLRLIYSLAVMQLIYDIGLLNVCLYWIPASRAIESFSTTFGGMGSNLWSNVISIVVVHIVVRLKSFDINYYYSKMLILITILSLGMAIATVLTAPLKKGDSFDSTALIIQDVYYYFRIAAIIFNVGCWVAVSRRLSIMGFKRKTGQGQSSLQAVMVLADRLKWYPIVQVFSRSGAAFYDYKYGYGTNGYGDNGEKLHDIALVCYAAFTPLAGIGYFVLFLKMQSEANEHFWITIENIKILLGIHCCCCVCFKRTPITIDNKNDSISINLKENNNIGSNSPPASARDTGNSIYKSNHNIQGEYVPNYNRDNRALSDSQPTPSTSVGYPSSLSARDASLFQYSSHTEGTTGLGVSGSADDNTSTRNVIIAAAGAAVISGNIGNDGSVYTDSMSSEQNFNAFRDSSPLDADNVDDGTWNQGDGNEGSNSMSYYRYAAMTDDDLIDTINQLGREVYEEENEEMRSGSTLA